MKYKVYAKMLGKSRVGCFGTYYGEQQKAAADLNFEAAAELRDKMIELKQKYQEYE